MGKPITSVAVLPWCTQIVLSIGLDVSLIFQSTMGKRITSVAVLMGIVPSLPMLSTARSAQWQSIFTFTGPDVSLLFQFIKFYHC